MQVDRNDSRNPAGDGIAPREYPAVDGAVHESRRALQGLADSVPTALGPAAGVLEAGQPPLEPEGLPPGLGPSGRLDGLVDLAE